MHTKEVYKMILLLQFEWYRKYKKNQYDRLYAASPNGREMAYKYNRHRPRNKMNGSWLVCYVSGRNTNVKQVSL